MPKMNARDLAVDKCMEAINDGVVLMTLEEECHYRQGVVSDLVKWVNNFKKYVESRREK